MTHFDYFPSKSLFGPPALSALHKEPGETGWLTLMQLLITLTTSLQLKKKQDFCADCRADPPPLKLNQ